MVAKAANHSIQERRFRSWEGEAPAEPRKSHNRIADTDPQVTYYWCEDGRCRIGLTYKTCPGGNPLHVCYASPGDGRIAFRLGRSLALPTYGFVRVRTVPMWHRCVSVSQQHTGI